MDRKFDIIVVGAGLVGLSTAFKIQQKMPNKRILILEKETSVSLHQSGRNSGVLHSGLYYNPGSLKADNCVKGRRELVDFAIKHKIKHDVCGKLVVATNQKELSFLPKLLNRGIKNGLKKLEILNPSEMKEREPFVSGLGAIFVPETGIIDYKQVAHKLVDLIKKINSKSGVITNSEVSDFYRNEKHSVVVTNKQKFYCENIIFCAGLFSDRLAKKDGLKLDLKIVGFRGDYYTLTDQASHKVNNLIYPVPNPEFPFLGVHFTRMTCNEIECGPNAVFTFKREGYKKGDFNFKDTLDALNYLGTWKLFAKHWRFGLNEIVKASSKRVFLHNLKKLIPSLAIDDIVEGRSGVRAMALGSNGDVIDDFKIVQVNKNIHVLNAPSPAATACLSIGESISQIYLNQKN
ncbi:MAG: L-2-hydroxyglutarate oxidase [Flavobacteriales bacterium]|jgi:L-2-hydroxyglutarate oxidase|nr:L-2-hydroxyglutarate oxidase [Flavobacteriales bacterium]|tara:strand:- start:391 stop:1602 length:1212 start_codon:yes stop_codon:yes gene_type:complete